MNTHALLRELIIRLEKYPNATKKEFRNQLLVNVPGGEFVMRSENPNADLNQIFQFAESLGKLDSGDWALDTVFTNLFQQLPPKTEIYNYLQQKSKDVIKAVESQYEINIPHAIDSNAKEAVLEINFTNHENIINEVFNNFSPPHFLFDAPAGFGKTALLTTLGIYFKNQNYKCAMISANSYKTLAELVKDLGSKLEVNISIADNEDDANKLGFYLGRAVNAKFIPQQMPLIDSEPQYEQYAGLVLLVDDLGHTMPKITEELLTKFLPSLDETLHGISYFGSVSKRFRIMIAGRYLAEFVDELPKTIGMARRTIEPFSYEVIKQTALKRLPLQNPDYLKQIAAHALHLTGGHPFCISQVLDLYKENSAAPEMFVDLFSDIIWKDYVSLTIEKIRNDVIRVDGKDEIKVDLRPILDTLSIYRFFNTDILEILNTRTTFQQVDDVDVLADQLTGTYLVSRKKRLLRDDITRRLLVIRLRHNLNADEFVSSCKQAYDMYLSFLEDEGLQDRELWAIECFYQALQMSVYEIQDIAQRSTLQKDFYVNQTSEILKVYVKGRRDIRAEMRALAYEMDRDWEFQFMINYYLRMESYDNDLYLEFKKNLMESSKTLLSGSNNPLPLESSNGLNEGNDAKSTS